MRFSNLLYRSWFYFRTGYNTYIAFLIGFIGNIVIIYKLALAGTFLQSTLFAHLSTFVAATLLVVVPTGIGVGLFHMKRTGAFAAEASVAIESNPYVYKVAPGKEQEVFLPLMILTARGLAKIMDQQQVMTPDQKKEFEAILSKANSLLAGQVVGLPRQRDLLREVRKAEQKNE